MKRRNFLKYLNLMTLGTLILLFFGVTRLAFKFGVRNALEYGFYPFWTGAVIKILVGAIVVYYINRILKGYSSSM